MRKYMIALTLLGVVTATADAARLACAPERLGVRSYNERAAVSAYKIGKDLVRYNETRRDENRFAAVTRGNEAKELSYVPAFKHTSAARRERAFKAYNVREYDILGAALIARHRLAIKDHCLPSGSGKVPVGKVGKWRKPAARAQGERWRSSKPLVREAKTGWPHGTGWWPWRSISRGFGIGREFNISKEGAAKLLRDSRLIREDETARRIAPGDEVSVSIRNLRRATRVPALRVAERRERKLSEADA